MELIGDLWARATAVRPPPDTPVMLALAATALLAVLLAWPLVRTLTTVCHEAGHALVARLAGRRLQGIRVHSDTSGLTVTSGRPSGIGMVATLLAGYPAASAVGLAAAYLVAMGHSAGLLWLLVCGLAVMLLALRNLYGALVVLLAGTALAAASWFASPVLAVGLATLLAWTLLLAGPRPVIELLATRAPTSDAAQLARLTRVPRPVWILGWLALNTAALGLGGSWLLRPG